MAKIVLGVWTTHGPQLNTTPEQWMLRLPADRGRKHAYQGKTYSFDELVQLRRGEPLAGQITLEARTANHEANQAAIDELARVWARVKPDCCVIFGNDQRELVLPSLNEVSETSTWTVGFSVSIVTDSEPASPSLPTASV